MKKMSLSLLTAATLAIGALTIAAPAQAATATAITPNIQYYYQWFHFDTYPPYGYSDPDTGFIGNRVQVIQNADGSYEGEYYGSDQI